MQLAVAEPQRRDVQRHPQNPLRWAGEERLKTSPRGVRRSAGFLPMPVRVFFRAMVAAPDLLEIHCGLGEFHFQGLEILHEDL
jgi:hypothetical protein